MTITAAVWDGDECALEEGITIARRRELEEEGFSLWPLNVVRDTKRRQVGKVWIFSKMYPSTGKVQTAMKMLVSDWHHSDQGFLDYPEPPA